jgi:hypothetical protein
MGQKDIHTIKLRFTDKGITLEISFGRNVMFSDKQLYKKAIIDLLSTKYSKDKINVID